MTTVALETAWRCGCFELEIGGQGRRVHRVMAFSVIRTAGTDTNQGNLHIFVHAWLSFRPLLGIPGILSEELISTGLLLMIEAARG